MKPGFSLLELQAALLVGMVVVFLAGTTLRDAHRAKLRMERAVRYQMEIVRLDATLQWVIFRAKKIERDGDGLVVTAPDGRWRLSPSGLTHAGGTWNHGAVPHRIRNLDWDPPELRLVLELSFAGPTQRVTLVYASPYSGLGL